MYIFVDILLKMLLLYRYFLETYPFIKLFFYWNWFFFLRSILVLLLRCPWQRALPRQHNLLDCDRSWGQGESGWREKSPFAGREPLCSRRKEVCQQRWSPSLSPSLAFGLSLFQLFSMDRRCRSFDSREEVRKPLFLAREAVAGLVGPCGLCLWL